MKLEVLNGDSREILKSLPDNSIDSLVTDPPSGIAFLNLPWDWDKGGMWPWIRWLKKILDECHRVMKPGSHGLVWALPRTAHWTAMALECSGFEIRDSIHHTFGQGFIQGNLNCEKYVDESLKGMGTLLKRAHEVWWLVRKPIEKGLTLSDNIRKWNAGYLNVDGCRVLYKPGDNLKGKKIKVRNNGQIFGGNSYQDSATKGDDDGIDANEIGRWPPNVLFSHAPECSFGPCVAWCPVRDFDEANGVRASSSRKAGQQRRNEKNILGGKFRSGASVKGSGAVSRYFPVFYYHAKPGRSEKTKGLEGDPLRPSQKLNPGGINDRKSRS